jgi:GNAT superfamily N-acetyltransferase
MRSRNKINKMNMSFTYKIVELEAAEAKSCLSELADILVDAVESGAWVSFMLPFIHAEAIAYWNDVIAAVTDRRTVLLAALLDSRVVGTVQLSLSTPPNQSHRAEIAKSLVHRAARGRGIGRALMEGVEELAHRHSRTLLTLDTLAGSVAEKLYLSLGYVHVGTIPGYARLPSGPLIDTSIFYKQL